jgi:hypothetical protein
MIWIAALETLDSEGFALSFHGLSVLFSFIGAATFWQGALYIPPSVQCLVRPTRIK